MTGKALAADRVAIGGGGLRTTGRPLTPGETASVSIRQHDIEILTAAPATADNTLHAVIGRQVFLGAARDYTVVLDDRTEIRVTARTDLDIAPGREVWLTVPAEKCRALVKGIEE